MVTGYDRKNLYFAVEKPKDKTGALLEYLGKTSGEKAVLFTAVPGRRWRRSTKPFLGEGYPAVRYHAGLSDKEKKENQEDFIYDRKPIMVATNAFGMGN